MLNKIYHTNPIIAHAPGDADFNLFWKNVLYKSTQVKTTSLNRISNLTILTWNSSEPQVNKKLGTFEQSLRNFNYNFNVLTTDKKWTSNRIKITLLNQFLKSIDTEYVLGADSSDVVVVSAIDDIITKFIQFDCDILFNAEKRFWPYDQMQHIKSFEDSIGLSPFKYLNAGLWIATKLGCINFFKKCEEYSNIKIHPYSEQVCVKHAYKDLYPLVKVDHKCEIFQNLNLVRMEELEVI